MKKVMKISGLVFLFLGIGLVLFPITSDIYFQNEMKKVIVNHHQETCKEKMNYGDLKEKLNVYNHNLYISHQKNLKDPWSYQQAGFDLNEYGFTDNIIGSIKIEKINVELAIYLGASGENLNRGATLMTETSIPIGGINTNAVVAAHRGMLKTRMFRDIDDLNKGDLIEVYTFCDTLKYRVTSSKIIAADDIIDVLIQDNKDMITLISCDGKNDINRIVVYCERMIDENI